MDPAQMQQMIAKAQTMAQELQKELLKKTAEGSAGGGMVTAVVDGQGELVRLKIEPTAVDIKDLSMLEDLVVAAVHDAHTKVKGIIQDEMQKMAGGMGLPFPGL